MNYSSETEVWLLCTDVFCDERLFRHGTEILPDCGLWLERKRRIGQFRNPGDRRLSLGAGLLIRHLFNITGTDYFSLEKSEYGRLYVRSSPYQFSVSHSGKYVVLSYGNCANGIDIERITDGTNIARKYFSSDENAVLADDDSLTFTRIWTRKEAYSKLCGLGLGMPFDTFSVVPNGVPLSMANCIEIGAECYKFQEFRINEYQIAVCSTSDISKDLIIMNADSLF